MTAKFEELVSKLKEIFQLDKPELDFGVYRIMHTRAKEITEFLEKRLAEKVRAALAGNSAAEKAALENELSAAVKNAQDLGADPDVLPKVRELKEKIAALGGDDDAEASVYSHLLAFFSRYYDDGDFISKRRYKDGVYAIPYSGEEVKLHWANADQYYIKSGENFQNYDFSLDGGAKVHFKLVTAETAKDNIKDNEAVRCFVLWDPANKANVEDEELADSLPDKILEEKDGELYIYFQYLKFKKGTKQADFTKQAVEKIAQELGGELLAKYPIFAPAPTEKDKKRTVLEKHFTTYTEKNTSDYFIHKDLGEFLRRELDFYIKNEMMHLDDIQNIVAFKEIEKNLRQIQAVRTIASELITFMAQLEDFQKKLWLKKKFVTQCDYCLTMDLVPQELHAEVFANEKQLEEWRNLGVEADPKAGNMLATDARMVDTKFFDETFKAKLLASIPDLDNKCRGLLIRGENFQALNLIKYRYKSTVQCVYIDPPFNLKQNGDFLYRTDYKDSTWMALLYDRVAIAKGMLSRTGMMFIRCDYNGNHLVRGIGDGIFGADQMQAELLVQRIRKNITGQGHITLPLANDSLFLYFNSKDSEYADPYLHLKEVRAAYWRRMDDSAGFRNPPERSIFGRVFYPYKHDAHFKFSQETIEKMIADGRICLTCKKCGAIHTKGDWNGCPKCGSDEVVPKYLVNESDKQVLDTNWMDIAGYASTTGFSTENSESLLNRVIQVSSRREDVVMDYFGGSGTTLSVANKSGRRWIGVEMGDQFYQYILPRLKTSKMNNTCFKYLTLESYEDALNNIELENKGDLLDGAVKDEYLLGYMLDVESKGSIINTDDFRHPFDYQLKIAVDSSGASEKRKIDLVETFNYLIGLRVAQYVREIAKGYAFLDGTLPNGEKAFVMWRDCDKVNDEELNKLLAKFSIKPGTTEYDVIYVNGDHAIANVSLGENAAGKVLKVRQIENEFLDKMFAETK